jgi:probable HAF family extracellular repeat protein
MKTCCCTLVLVTTLLALAIRAPVLAQEQRRTAAEETGHVVAAAAQKHHHYKLVDVGTLGGPNTSVGFESFPMNALSSQGAFTACADTATSNPNYPNFNPNIPLGFHALPQPDPMIFHAFEWKNAKLSDLGALPGVNNSCATHISGNGMIAGESENGAIDPITGWPAVQAVLWKRGELIDLGTLGGNESFPNSVNNRGQVVGQAANSMPDPFPFPGFGQQARAFLWENGVMHDLGTLGGPDAFAIDINDRGQILGVSFTNSTPEPTTGIPTLDGFLWENGKMTDIPDPLGGTQVSPLYLSDKGQVVGSANLTGDNFEQARHPFLWENGVFTDLPMFGGTVGDANKINDAGQIVGDAGHTGTDQFGMPLYHAAIWHVGVPTDLGTLEGDPCSGGQDINSRGHAVGWSGTCDTSNQRPFLWEDGGPMVDLNALISPYSGIYLFFAANIDDRGEIAAAGVLPNGETRAVLLIPCDDGHPNVEGCDYNLVDAGSTAQRLVAKNESHQVPTVLRQRISGRFRIRRP